MKKTHITYLLLVEVKGLVMFDQLHTLLYSCLWCFFGAWLFTCYLVNRFCHQHACVDMWSASNGIIGDQQSILSINKNRSLCKRTVTCNIYCTDISATTFGFWDHLTFYQDFVQAEFYWSDLPRKRICCNSVHVLAAVTAPPYTPLLEEKGSMTHKSMTRVRAAWEFWLLLLWVHFLFFILHTQPPFQSVSFVLSCCQEESSPLKVSNNNKAAFLAFVLCPGHSDETSHSKNLFVCSFICDLPLETKDLNTCGILQCFHLWFESSLYVTLLCNFFHNKRSSGFHSYP